MVGRCRVNFIQSSVQCMDVSSRRSRCILMSSHAIALISVDFVKQYDVRVYWFGVSDIKTVEIIILRCPFWDFMSANVIAALLLCESQNRNKSVFFLRRRRVFCFVLFWFCIASAVGAHCTKSTNIHYDVMNFYSKATTYSLQRAKQNSAKRKR